MPLIVENLKRNLSWTKYTKIFEELGRKGREEALGKREGMERLESRERMDNVPG